ncbi:putative aminotransferase [Hypoxylon trugodes]|uniref:putative aminotransferase n=1 Tax=Hypoxylon trugodes TaxID=326681 RepID=UPI0021957CA0|nr:putative aminotransferase [Hypoxylon trugodes]KAI1382726.1 putative aminotransferase [Hypoxylon trugodes]
MAPNGEYVEMMPTGALAFRIRSMKPVSKPADTFYRNLEEALDQRRAAYNLRCVVESEWQTMLDMIDFSSNDVLSWNARGTLRGKFLDELAQHPNFNPGAGGSRLLDGFYSYLEATEREIAEFHSAEAGLIVNSGFEANLAVWKAIPRPGDVIVYDSLVHASTHEGLGLSLAMQKVEFLHSETKSFREVLLSVLDSQPLIKQGKRCVLVAVESVYSMDGDVCPLQELIDVADEVFQGQDNIKFFVDEAHSTGVFGPNGSGLVRELGLESRVAVRVHTFGKAIGATGACILGHKTIKSALLNFARSTTFTTAPSFPFVAAIKAGYNLLQSEEGRQSMDRLQHIAQLFYKTLTTHPLWQKARNEGILWVPLADGWESRSFLTHIVPIWTRQKYLYWLYFHLLSSGYCTWPIEHPVVAPGQGRIRMTVHAANTEAQIENFVSSMFAWVEEILAIEEGATEAKASKAAAKVYEWMRSEGLEGWGLV